MKDFEKFLTELPRPDVDVPAFRAQLRRELVSVAPARSSPGMRLALGLTGSLAAAFALLLVLFVARPGVPEDIHAALIGPTTVPIGDASVGQLLHRATAPVEADQAFVENWTARQEAPLQVRSIESERMFSVRQFELSDGKRMLVFTELGSDRPRSTLMPAVDPAQVF